MDEPTFVPDQEKNPIFLWYCSFLFIFLKFFLSGNLYCFQEVEGVNNFNFLFLVHLCLHCSYLDEPQHRMQNGSVEQAYRQSPYIRDREPSKEQPISHAEKGLQRQRSLESDQLPNDVLRRLSRDYETESRRRYSASDESEDSTMYHMQKDFAAEGLSESSPRQLSQDVDDERDVDMPYVIGQFNLENKLYRKPFFLNRASTFCAKNHDSLLKVPKKSNLKRAISYSPKSSLKSCVSNNSRSVIYEEIAL